MKFRLAGLSQSHLIKRKGVMTELWTQGLGVLLTHLVLGGISRAVNLKLHGEAKK